MTIISNDLKHNITPLPLNQFDSTSSYADENKQIQIIKIKDYLKRVFSCWGAKKDNFSFLRKLTNITDPMTARWMYAERYMNGETEIHKPHASNSEVSIDYQPKSNTPSIKLPCFLLDKNKVTIFCANPSSEVSQALIKNSHVIFPIHPDMLQSDELPYVEVLRKSKKLESLCAVPTSSSRTVLPLKEKYPVPFHIKLDYRNNIGQFKRTLSRNFIEHAVGVSKILESVKYEKFGYLPESVGVALGEGGYILRETTPRPIVDDKRQLLPLFSIYGKDIHHPNEPPLLAKLIDRSKKDPKTYVLENVLFPLIACFIEAYKQQGILLSCHGQNILIELNDKLEITRFISRDFDNHVDKEWRKKLGLPDFFPNEKSADAKVRSLMYDNALGRAVLDYITALMEKNYGIPPEELRQPCRELFKRTFPDDLSLPTQTHCYAKTPGSDKHLIISRGELPAWRPVPHKNTINE